MSQGSFDGHDELRQMLGAYVLGGLAHDEQQRMDRHVRDCADCRDELARLASVRLVLDRNRPWLDDTALDSSSSETEDVDQLALRRLLAAAAAEDRQHRRRGRVRLIVAAAVITVAAAAGVGFSLVDDPSATVSTAVMHSDSRAAGKVQVEEKAWGSALELDATGLNYYGNLSLDVRSVDGHHEIAATWGPTPDGQCRVEGATSIAPSDISNVRVVDSAGHDVLWVDMT